MNPATSTRSPIVAQAEAQTNKPFGLLAVVGLQCLLVYLSRAWFPPYGVMWLAAVLMFWDGKFIAWNAARTKFAELLEGASKCTLRKKRNIFLFLYSGMDAKAFLQPCRHQPAPREWLHAAIKTVCGAGLMWVGARAALQVHPWLAGWVGMIGLILWLHFGLFHLLALIWRTRGYNARPIMNAPGYAESLSDFWGRRWNLAFHALAKQIVFDPLKLRIGPPMALMATFLASGIVHEMVITVPARAGYGLPTCYFLLQGFGILATRSSTGKQLGLSRGIAGRIFAWLLIIGPAFWLFPPPFIERVMRPFLQAIKAL